MMKIIVFLAIFTAVSAVSFPARIEKIGYPSIPKNDYTDVGPTSITYFQDVTKDLGLTLAYNLTSGDGQLVASEGPKLVCEKDLTTQYGSLVGILVTAQNQKDPTCPHPKGTLNITREFNTVLIFDDMPAPPCGSNFTIDMETRAPDVEEPINSASFYIFPICDDDGSSN